MGTLVVKNLSFRSRHGYFDFEREVGNNFEVDLLFRTNLALAGQTDSLEDTLDYAPASQVVEEVMAGEPVHLIETLLARIGASLMSHFPEVNYLEVRLRKIKPPIHAKCDYVEICDQWQR
jgi:7,8-dihydroneopterin aldolase/epimerase/oxygenase